ncbi:MAG: aminotransferase class V-fold PLP-dependent enzyme, partial [Christensenellaceae bacterium]
MIYFDHAATGGLKPPEVLRAVHAALAVSANPGRSGHRLSMAAAERVYRTRRLLDEYFSGYGPERVVFTKNCTEALNIAIHSLQGHVVTTELEHNSVLRPLFARGNYSICPLKNGAIEVDLLLSYLRADTVALVITLASNVTGYAPDVKALRKKLPPSVLLICDGAQYCGHKRLSLREWGIDALAVAGHKGMYGIQGSGVLLFSERFSPVPLLQGGTGTDSTSLAMPEYYPERLESGTLN